jgi:hypothetical protein
MSENVISFEEFKNKATTVIEIPGFSPDEKIKVRVKKPNMMSMLSQGKIPNHLTTVIYKMLGIDKKERKEKNKEEENKKLAIEAAKMYELYACICLVDPSYEEIREYLIDEQLEAIFNWATSEVKGLENFRENKDDGTNNNDGETLQQIT